MRVKIASDASVAAVIFPGVRNGLCLNGKMVFSKGAWMRQAPVRSVYALRYVYRLIVAE